MQTRIQRLLTAYETARLTRRELLRALALAGTSSALVGRSLSARTRPQLLQARSMRNVSVDVSDLQRSVRFYQQLFDVSAVRTLSSSGGEAYGLDFNGRLITLHPRPTGGVITDFAIGVDGFQAGRDGAAIRAAGYEVVASADDHLFVSDPDGIRVQITDADYTAACPSCPPPPAEAAGLSGGSDPLFQARTLNHVSMGVSDQRASVAFYQDLFGLGAPRPLLPPGAGILGLDINESYLSLSPAGARAGTITHFCVGVADFDLERDMARIRALGLSVRELTPGANNQTVYVNDPDGLSVQIVADTWKSLCPDCDPAPFE
ncbi:MAG: VOC family protein [Gammaproteobacteria bacterium]|nr:VOC family protein [Gammaproteobacteria bacterium]